MYSPHPNASIQASIADTAMLDDPATLTDVEVLRAALHRANLRLVEQQVKLHMHSEALRDVAQELAQVVGAFLRSDAEAVANYLQAIAQRRVVVLDRGQGAVH